MHVIITYRKENITHIRMVKLHPSKKGWRRGIVNYVSDILGGTFLYADVIN